jgi:hypothetical protein
MAELKTVRVIYKKLLALYPRDFRERFGESMEQTFDDLCRERQQTTGRISAGFAARQFAETSAGIVNEHFLRLKKGKVMQNMLTNRMSAAAIAFLMAMPFAVLLLIETNNIEPLSSAFRGLTTNADSYSLNDAGRVLIITSILLLPAAFAVSLAPIVRARRAGRSVVAMPLNLSLAASLFIFIATLIAFFVADQYPCWIGVPNCD